MDLTKKYIFLSIPYFKLNSFFYVTIFSLEFIPFGYTCRMIIGDRYHQNPFEKGTLFLFCGRRTDRIKGLLWMGSGFLLLYKRFEAGSLTWPRTEQEAAELTEEQFHYLMLGLNPLDPKIKEITPKKVS